MARVPVLRAASGRLLLAAGSLSFAVFLVTSAPAALLGRVLAGAGVQASGLSGTFWSGEARAVQLGPLRLDELRWRTHPTRLLTGRLAADVAGKLPDGFLSGSVALGLGGTVKITDLQAASPLAPLAAGAPPESQVSVQVTELGLGDGWITAARGTLRVGGVSLDLPGIQGNRAALGSYELTFDTDAVSAEQPLTAALKDAGGPLEIEGTVVLTPPRNYEINGTARARDGAPNALVQALQMSGPRDAEGRHTVSLAGSF